MPVIQSGTEVFTFQDAVEHLLDLHEIDRNGLNERRARAAVLQAYRDLPFRHTWNYYYRQRLLQTVTQQTSSTITYDHTGGASERLVTIAAGTWPSWAAYGRLIIDEVAYEIEDRKSPTTLTLEATSNPGADLAAGTSYVLYQSAYPLPADFRSLCRIWDVDENRELKRIDPSQHHSGLMVSYKTPATPYEVAVRATGEYQGGFQLHFSPPPDTAKTYDMLYVAAARKLSIDEYSTGTVSVTSGDATVTGTAPASFPTNCVGSVIRFSSTPALPSGLVGALDGTDNPFVLQGIIKEWTDATHVELSEAPTVSLSGVAFTISDPLDIEPGAMLTAMLRAAEAEFCVKAGRKDDQMRLALARQALLEAMEADARLENLGKRLPPYDPYTRTTLTSE